MSDDKNNNANEENLASEKNNLGDNNLESKVTIGPLQLFQTNGSTPLSSMSFSTPTTPAQAAIIKDPNNTATYTTSVVGLQIVTSFISYNSGIDFWVLYVTPNGTAGGNTTVTVSDGVRVANVAVSVTAIVGPLTISPTALNFITPSSPYQTITISDPYNTNPYTLSGSNPGTVSLSLAGNVLYVTPLNVGQIAVNVSDGVRFATAIVTVNAGIGPITVNPPSALFNQANIYSPTFTISDPNNTAPYSITSSVNGVVQVNFSGGNTFTLTAIGLGQTTLTISDGVRYVLFTATVSYFVYPPPAIYGLTSTYGCVFQNITVIGNNFSALRDSATINNVPAPLVVNSATEAVVTVPSTTVGTTSLVITDGISNAYAGFTVLGQPQITSIFPTQPVIGNALNIRGNNFGNTIDQINGVYISGVSVPFTYPQSNELIITIPITTPLGPNQLYVQTACGDSSVYSVNIITTNIVTISPNTAIVSANTEQQFTATFYPNGIEGNSIDVTNNCTWQVNGVTGGEGTHGAISPTGIYTAPLTNPITQIVVGFIYDDSQLNINLQAQAVVNLTSTPQIVMSPSIITLQPSQQQQYTVYLVATVNNVLTEFNITNDPSTAFAVNGTTNGNTIDGIMTNTGLYTAPGNFSASTQIDISASYLYQGQLYVGHSVTVVEPFSSNYANITVNSQLNIYLGDGRFGYVPAGAQTIAYPNQYVFVQFQELLNNQNLLPDPTYLPVQQLSLGVKNALDSDIANVIYNLGDMSLNSDGTTNTLRTVIIGIVDPSDGLFHTMWDINNPLPSSTGNLPHSIVDNNMLMTKNNNISENITSYINKLSETTQQKIDILNSRSSIMLAGTCSYSKQNNTFEILDNIHILGILGDNTYGTFGIIPKQKITVNPNQFIYIDSNQNLKVEDFSVIFNDAKDVKNIVVGAVLDDFYTTWPLIKQLEVNTSNVNEINKNSYVEIGPMIVQWGISEKQYNVDKKSIQTNKIKFVKNYEKSCIVLLNTQNSTGGIPQLEANNITVEDFEAKIINLGSTNVKTDISWCAIGV